MAKDRELNELKDYTFDIMIHAILEGRDEIMFIYNEKTYSLGIDTSNNKSIFFRGKKQPTLKCLYNETDNFEVSKFNNLDDVDTILVEGKKFKDIWDDVIVI